MTEQQLELMCEHMEVLHNDITLMLGEDINKETKTLLECIRSDMIGLEDRIQNELK